MPEALAHNPMLKIATWNLCKGNSSKKIEALIGRESPDIIALQETSHMVDPVFTPEYNFAWGGNPRHGVGLGVKAPLEVFAAPTVENGPKSIFPFVVNSTNIRLHVLVVWTAKDPHYIADFLRSLDLYGGFLRESEHFLVLGDFNAHPSFNKENGRNKLFEQIPDRLREEFGLFSAYHQFHQKPHGDERHPTHYYWWRETKPFHIDYIFVSPSWRIESLSVGDFNSWKTLSDHRPMIAQFNIPER